MGVSSHMYMRHAYRFLSRVVYTWFVLGLQRNFMRDLIQVADGKAMVDVQSIAENDYLAHKLHACINICYQPLYLDL